MNVLFTIHILCEHISISPRNNTQACKSGSIEINCFVTGFLSKNV